MAPPRPSSPRVQRAVRRAYPVWMLAAWLLGCATPEVDTPLPERSVRPAVERISERDLGQLERLQDDRWEVFQVVNIRGSLGFTAHVLFMLRRKLQ